MPKRLSGPQRRLLEAIADGTECPVRGNSYRTARVLAEQGLARLTVSWPNRRVTITEAGRRALDLQGEEGRS